MVCFEDKSYTIEIETGGNPIENYQALQTEIAYVFSVIGKDQMPEQGLFYLADLLMQLQPEWEVAKKMTM